MLHHALPFSHSHGDPRILRMRNSLHSDGSRRPLQPPASVKESIPHLSLSSYSSYQLEEQHLFWSCRPLNCIWPEHWSSNLLWKDPCASSFCSFFLYWQGERRLSAFSPPLDLHDLSLVVQGMTSMQNAMYRRPIMSTCALNHGHCPAVAYLVMPTLVCLVW